MIFNRLSQFFDDPATQLATSTSNPKGGGHASPMGDIFDQQSTFSAAEIYSRAWEQARQKVQSRRQTRNRIAQFF